MNRREMLKVAAAAFVLGELETAQMMTVTAALYSGDERMSEQQPVTFGFAEDGAAKNDAEVRFENSTRDYVVNRVALFRGDNAVAWGDVRPRRVDVGNTAMFCVGDLVITL